MSGASRPGAGWLLRAAAIAPLATGVLAYFVHDGFRSLLDQGAGCLIRRDLDGLRRWAEAVGPWAPLATSLLMVVQAIAAPIPAFLVTATNSFLFGPFWGGLLSIVAATVAAVVCYLLARVAGEALAGRLVSAESLNKADAFLHRHGALAILTARLLPIVPFDPISYAAGLVRLPLGTFCWATLVGQIPAGMAYSYLAQEVLQPERFAVLAAVVLAVLLVVGWSVRRVLLKRAAARN